MLFNLFVYLFILLLAGQKAKAAIRIDPASCGSEWTETVQNALQEIERMGNVASQYVNDGLDGTLTGIGARARYNTFLTYFGADNKRIRTLSARYLLSKSFLIKKFSGN